MSGRKTSIRAVVAVLSVVASVGLIAPSARASTDSRTPKIKVTNQVGLQAGGAGVVMTFGIRCAKGAHGDLSGEITQMSPDGYPVSSYGYSTVTCTGKTQKVMVGVAAVQSQEGGPYPTAPFTVGSAFVSGDLNVCDDEHQTCDEQKAAKTVRVRDITMDRSHFANDTVTIDLPETGQLQADGAGVIVSVPYHCAPGVYANFGGTLAQVISDGYVNAAGDSLTLSCTDTNRDGLLIFHAYFTAWQAGDAFITLDGQVCDPFGDCDYSASLFRTIAIA